jgi:hypothetical protein
MISVPDLPFPTLALTYTFFQATASSIINEWTVHRLCEWNPVIINSRVEWQRLISQCSNSQSTSTAAPHLLEVCVRPGCNSSGISSYRLRCKSCTRAEVLINYLMMRLGRTLLVLLINYGHRTSGQCSRLRFNWLFDSLLKTIERPSTIRQYFSQSKNSQTCPSQNSTFVFFQASCFHHLTIEICIGCVNGSEYLPTDA